MKTKIKIKLKNNSILGEALLSVLPITAIVLLIYFCLPNKMGTFNLISFILGNVFLIAGMTFYGAGTRISLDPIGNAFGEHITMKRKVWIMLAIGFLIGFLITIAEPDLSVLGEQLGSVKWILIITIALGVGLFLCLALLKIVLKWDLPLIIMVMYGIIFLLSLLAERIYIPLCFDAGGVTTGALTVPFIMAIGVSVAGTIGGKSKDENSFGLISICSVGPILMTLLLCLLFKPEVQTDISITQMSTFKDMLLTYAANVLTFAKEVAIALAPITVLFLIFDKLFFKLPRIQIRRIVMGLIYTYIGLTLFLTGANSAYMTMGYFIGTSLAGIEANWLLIPIGAVIGFFIIFAEPAVNVLSKQVEAVSSGLVKKSTIRLALGISMAFAIALSMVRALVGISIWYVIGIGYVIALGLSLLVPKVYTAIAFDSGGVASGPMTATFLMPLAIGVASVTNLNGDITTSVLSNAYGLVATVAMMPLITIQVVGLAAKLKQRKLDKQASKASTFAEGDIIGLNDDDDIIELG